MFFLCGCQVGRMSERPAYDTLTWCCDLCWRLHGRPRINSGRVVLKAASVEVDKIAGYIQRNRRHLKQAKIKRLIYIRLDGLTKEMYGSQKQIQEFAKDEGTADHGSQHIWMFGGVTPKQIWKRSCNLVHIVSLLFINIYISFLSIAEDERR